MPHDKNLASDPRFDPRVPCYQWYACDAGQVSADPASRCSPMVPCGPDLKRHPCDKQCEADASCPEDSTCDPTCYRLNPDPIAPGPGDSNAPGGGGDGSGGNGTGVVGGAGGGVAPPNGTATNGTADGTGPGPGPGTGPGPNTNGTTSPNITTRRRRLTEASSELMPLPPSRRRLSEVSFQLSEATFLLPPSHRRRRRRLAEVTCQTPPCKMTLPVDAAGKTMSGVESFLGRAVQVDPIKPTLKAPGTERLNLEYDGPLPNFAFNFDLRRYTSPWCSCPSPPRPSWTPASCGLGPSSSSRRASPAGAYTRPLLGST